MGFTQRNAVILAAGTSSRFVPLSAECPKGLLNVKGEVLIERQIRQLNEADITDITIVTGYMADKYLYLKEKFGVDIVFNEDFNRYNNSSSVVKILDRLKNTYICSSDNYFTSNVFTDNPTESYYSALYAAGETNEYCLETDDNNNIVNVSIGGCNSWYMIGHVYFSKSFSEAFREILASEYKKEETRYGYWEDVYIRFIHQLPAMKMRCYKKHEIEEFDTIDELRIFDTTYVDDTRSSVIKEIAKRLGSEEAQLSCFTRVKHEGNYLLFDFMNKGVTYRFDGSTKSLTQI